MQPFATTPSAQNVILALVRDAFRRNDLIVRFLADSACYLGLAAPLPEKPDRKFHTRIFQTPIYPEREKP